MNEAVILPFQDSLSAGNGKPEQEGMLSGQCKQAIGHHCCRFKKNSEFSAGKNK
ncbi:hypothetical protein [Herbaspirillum sp. C7C8]|jgi:hypothetical protein|uniref:hypothetical protein n=1 Tax=Herbaspirillum sp. C7C8 TaxID=2736665 RepID=UPI001F51F89A|nr:hypothetical protein [Herbaspirillum sp. C7C8]MCI1007529.1 hypothetical protein [Herbaspirillum sp. C7C8]